MHFMNCLLVTSPFHARGYSTNLYPANQTTMHLHLNSNLVVHACNQTASLAGLAGLSMQPNNHLLHAHSLATGGLALGCEPGSLEKTTNHALSICLEEVRPLATSMHHACRALSVARPPASRLCATRPPPARHGLCPLPVRLGSRSGVSSPTLVRRGRGC